MVASRNYHAELERVSSFQWPDWCTEQTERDAYIRGIRQFTTVLALGQRAFRPKAKNLVWDIRDLNNTCLLDFDAPITARFDVAYLHDFSMAAAIMAWCRKSRRPEPFSMLTWLCKSTWRHISLLARRGTRWFQKSSNTVRPRATLSSSAFSAFYRAALSNKAHAPDGWSRSDLDASQAPAPLERSRLIGARASAPAAPAAKARKRKRRAAPVPATPVRPVKGKRNTPANSAITVQQHNPKHPGSASHRRYENYKRARTRDEFLALGGSAADLNHDSRKGFVVSGSPQRVIKRRTAEG